MWSMTGAVGQLFRTELSVAEAARREANSRPAGGRRPTRSTSRIYFVTASSSSKGAGHGA